MSVWSKAFRQSYGPALPFNYLSFDLETTGVSIAADLPLEIGHTIVRDGRQVNRASFYLDWTRHEDVDPSWLRYKLDQVSKHIAAKGGEFGIDWRTLQTKGQDPESVLEFYFQLFADNRKARAHLIGHNAVNFDAPMLRHTFKHFLDRNWWPNPAEIYDTGAIAKGCARCLLPRPNESLLAYCARACRARGKVRWALKHLADDYGITRQHGFTSKQFHGAGFDSYVTHLVFEHQRRLIEPEEMYV